MPFKIPARQIGGLTALALSVLALPAAAAAAPADLAGLWRLDGPFQPEMKTADGKEPPLKPEARRLLQQRIAARRAGKSGDGVEICLPPGTPRIMWMDRPFMLVVTPAKVTLLHEYQHTIRHIPLDEASPPADQLDPTYGGTSVGRWEGDTLVIETTGFNDLTQLDQAGLPHSTELKVVERLRLVDGGSTLEDVVTITDPQAYERPWTARVAFKRAPGVQMEEDVCAERLLDPTLVESLNKQPKR